VNSVWVVTHDHTTQGVSESFYRQYAFTFKMLRAPHLGAIASSVPCSTSPRP